MDSPTLLKPGGGSEQRWLILSDVMKLLTSKAWRSLTLPKPSCRRASSTWLCHAGSSHVPPLCLGLTQDPGRCCKGSYRDNKQGTVNETPFAKAPSTLVATRIMSFAPELKKRSKVTSEGNDGTRLAAPSDPEPAKVEGSERATSFFGGKSALAEG